MPARLARRLRRTAEALTLAGVLLLLFGPQGAIAGANGSRPALARGLLLCLAVSAGCVGTAVLLGRLADRWDRTP